MVWARAKTRTEARGRGGGGRAVAVTAAAPGPAGPSQPRGALLVQHRPLPATPGWSRGETSRGVRGNNQNLREGEAQ